MLKTPSNTIVSVCSICCNKILQTAWLKQQTHISCGSRGWKVQHQAVGEFSSWAVFLACRQLSSCRALTERKRKRKEEKEKGREREFWSSIMEIPLWWPHLNLITLQRIHPWILSHWGLETQPIDFFGGGHIHLVRDTSLLCLHYILRPCAVTSAALSKAVDS